jgi:hypothetical protein
VLLLQVDGAAEHATKGNVLAKEIYMLELVGCSDEEAGRPREKEFAHELGSLAMAISIALLIAVKRFIFSTGPGNMSPCA